MTKPGDPTKPTGDERDRALARLEKALGEALAASEASEAIVEDQRQRLKLLGSGREETMRALADARAEIKRVSQERDELRKQLSRIDSVQTATIALPENDPAAWRAADVPSLEDLMAALGYSEEPGGDAGHLHQHVQPTRDTDDAEEMIAPRLVFPEQFAETAKPGEEATAAASRVLVLLDPERPIKYALYKETMTIGRADIADIQIDNGFLSRLHARVISTPEGVTIEDFESKNGIRVNAKITPRQMLRHGDVVDLGRLRFRFIDTASDDAD
jgi:FHA domain